MLPAGRGEAGTRRSPRPIPTGSSNSRKPTHPARPKEFQLQFPKLAKFATASGLVSFLLSEILFPSWANLALSTSCSKY